MSRWAFFPEKKTKTFDCQQALKSHRATEYQLIDRQATTEKELLAESKRKAQWLRG